MKRIASRNYHIILNNLFRFAKCAAALSQMLEVDTLSVIDR
jgi:hypothetical protein